MRFPLTRRSRPQPAAFAAALLVAAVAGACREPGPATVVFRGATMGTTYTVRIVPRGALDRERLPSRIEEELERVDARMSTYREDSELSRFNRFERTEPFSVSAETFSVFEEAQDVSRLTGGAFDVTVAPLVNAWGFGPPERPAAPPSEQRIAAILESVGYTKLELDPEALTVRKSDPRVACDLSGIAKGYAVDRIADALEGEGLCDYMVEVGGEVRTCGVNASGRPWRIAIERPTSGFSEFHRVVPLSGYALATSGDYRSFYELGGNRISHEIDPRTGRPVTHALASVSVIHDLCVRADALATGLMILGPEEGYALAVERDWAASFIVREPGGEFRETVTPAFERVVSETPPVVYNGRALKDGRTPARAERVGTWASEIRAQSAVGGRSPQRAASEASTEMMTLFLLVAGIIGAAMLVMAVGAIAGRRCLRGSCGGPEVLGSDGQPLSCGACPRRREPEGAAAPR